MTNFNALLSAQATIHSALAPLSKALRDRVIRAVLDQLNSERPSDRLASRCVSPGVIPQDVA